MDDKRTRALATVAVQGFWGIVEKNFPHIKRGKVDPELARLLGHAAECAVLDWVERNDRDEWTEIGSVIKCHLDSADAIVAVGEEEILAYVWSSDYATFRTRALIRPLCWENRQYSKGPCKQGIADPGLVRLEYDLDVCKWFWVAENSARWAIGVELQEEAALKSAWIDPADRSVMVISEILGNQEPELMRVAMPASADQAVLARDSIRRLVGELNMAYHALLK